MLRCPPSRIDLTSSDLVGLEHRLGSRRTARLAPTEASRVRLSPGPAHQTKHGVVSATDNIGQRRATSSSSEATLFDRVDGEDEERPAAGLDNGCLAQGLTTSPSSLQRSTNDSMRSSEIARTLATTSLQQTPVDAWSPRGPGDGQTGTELPTCGEYQKVNTTVLSLDAAHGSWSNNNSDHINEAPPTAPRAFSSARARRRLGRSHATSVHHDHPDLQDLIYARHTERPELRDRDIANAPPPVPELIFPGVNAHASAYPALDPGAAVFVPRTRFGSATGSTAESTITSPREPQWSSVDTTHSFSNLRIRPSSEQNVEQPQRPRRELSELDDFGARDNVALGANRPGAAGNRRRRRATDQNVVILPVTPNLDRYPLLRPRTDVTTQRSVSGANRLHSTPSRDVSRQLSLTFVPLVHNAASSQLSQHFHVRRLITPDTAVTHHQTLTTQTRLTSPTTSVNNSRSASNLLNPPRSAPRAHSRGSSLPWTQASTTLPLSLHPTPRMVSGASGASASRGDRGRQSSREGLDAATEFLRMRSSPLDELTEKVTRLCSATSGGRPRSVGRSWERAPGSHGRMPISLLSGNPFGQEFGVAADLASPVKGHDRMRTTARNELAPDDEDPAPLSSSPPLLPSRFVSLPSTPPALPSSPLSTTRPALADVSPGKTTRSPPNTIPHKPALSMAAAAAATPRVSVYDDNRPSHVQPQTPADVSRSTRHIQFRSETMAQQSHVHVGRAIMAMSSPPAPPMSIPARHHAHRYTFPAEARGSDGGSNADTRRSQRGSGEETENEIQAHLHELEEDRHTWTRRRGEEGSLDVTPPAEGRFERYLA